MKVLVTGAGGFVGTHLMRHLRSSGHDPVGTTLAPIAGADYHILDLRDPRATADLIAQTQPEGVIHLAGIAYVPAAEKDPALAVTSNTAATAVLLDAVREGAPGCRLLYISSGEVYGRRCGSEPIGEDTPPDPCTVYSITKLAAEHLTVHAHREGGVAALIARPFNHFGPGQSSPFSIPSFARQIVEIERGEAAPVVRVGNLEARRDFTDVRDVVGAYTRLLERGTPGAIYNVCSGVAHSIREMLDRLITAARAEVTIENDPERMRASDLPVFCGQPGRIRAAVDWAPTISVEQTLRDVLDDWRGR